MFIIPEAIGSVAVFPTKKTPNYKPRSLLQWNLTGPPEVMTATCLFISLKMTGFALQVLHDGFVVLVPIISEAVVRNCIIRVSTRLHPKQEGEYEAVRGAEQVPKPRTNSIWRWFCVIKR